MKMLDSKADSQNLGNDNAQTGYNPAGQNQPQQQMQAPEQNQYNPPAQKSQQNYYGGMNNQARQNAPEHNIPEIDIDNDEIPF